MGRAGVTKLDRIIFLTLKVFTFVDSPECCFQIESHTMQLLFLFNTFEFHFVVYYVRVGDRSKYYYVKHLTPSPQSALFSSPFSAPLLPLYTRYNYRARWVRAAADKSSSLVPVRTAYLSTMPHKSPHLCSQWLEMGLNQVGSAFAEKTGQIINHG